VAALESVKRQSFREFECIVIDDGSSDDSDALISSAIQSDERFRFIKNVGNLGSAYTRKVGINNARGNYAFFLDGDDIICDDALSLMVAKSEELDVDLVIAEIEIFNEKKEVPASAFSKLASESILSKLTTNVYSWSDFLNNYSFLIESNYTNTLPAKLFKLSIWKKFNCSSIEGLTVGEDSISAKKYIFNVDRIAFLDRKIYLYRKGHASITQGRKPQALDAIPVTEYLIEYMSKRFTDHTILKLHMKYAVNNLTTHAAFFLPLHLFRDFYKMSQNVIRVINEKRMYCKADKYFLQQWSRGSYIGFVFFLQRCLSIYIKQKIFSKPFIATVVNFIIIVRNVTKSAIKRIRKNHHKIAGSNS
jgi:glycosyltransferase involved in cell wall biosynthesis